MPGAFARDDTDDGSVSVRAGVTHSKKIVGHRQAERRPHEDAGRGRKNICIKLSEKGL